MLCDYHSSSHSFSGRIAILAGAAASELDCTIVDQNWDGIIPALLAGKYEAIVASMQITAERKAIGRVYSKNFTTPPAMAGARSSKIKDWSPSGLKGKTIGAQSSTIYATFLEEQYRPDGVQIKLYGTQDEVKADLLVGRLDTIAADKVALSEWLKGAGAACYEI
jgi:polar amino acid transport system substrate-binding protein